MAHELDAQWLEYLKDGHPDEGPLLQELRHYLKRALRKILHRRSDFSDSDLEDFAQESVLRIIVQFPTFKGKSAFSTWAVAIATRVAFTELRNRRKRTELLAHVQEEAEASENWRVEHEHKKSEGEDLVWALYAGIRERLSPKQRTVILAELRGIPTIQIAESLHTNQNALYKLAHDARRKLKEHLISSGFSAESLSHMTSPEVSD